MDPQILGLGFVVVVAAAVIIWHQRRRSSSPPTLMPATAAHVDAVKTEVKALTDRIETVASVTAVRKLVDDLHEKSDDRHREVMAVVDEIGRRVEDLHSRADKQREGDDKRGDGGGDGGAKTAN